jgi:hypothetical protein
METALVCSCAPVFANSPELNGVNEIQFSNVPLLYCSTLSRSRGVGGVRGTFWGAMRHFQTQNLKIAPVFATAE